MIQKYSMKTLQKKDSIQLSARVESLESVCSHLADYIDTIRHLRRHWTNLVLETSCVFSCKLKLYKPFCKSVCLRLKFGEAFSLITFEVAGSSPHHDTQNFSITHTHNLIMCLSLYIYLSLFLKCLSNIFCPRFGRKKINKYKNTQHITLFSP